MRQTVRQNKTECTGCGACVSICPRKAITMQHDEEGFLYPVVDQALCISCDLCEKRCPVGHEHPEKDVIPAGLLYCQLHDPIVEKGKKLLNELKPSGVFNSSDEVIEHLEHNLTGDSEVLPIGRKKDGSLTARSKVMTEEDFFLVADYAEKKVREIGTSILKGAIDVEPYAMGEETGCKFCKYKSICGFDEKIPGYEYRHLEKLQIAEAIEKMREEEESWELNIQKNNNK